MSLIDFDPSKYRTTTQPGATTPQEQGRFGDVVDSVQAGAAAGLGGIFDFFGANSLAKSFYGLADDQYTQMSQRGQDAISKSIFTNDEQGNIALGEGATDLDTWLLGMANVAGQFIPTAVPGAGLAGAATKAASLGAKGAKVAQAVSMGGTGGASATGQAMEQARGEVMQIPDNLLADSAVFAKKFLEVDQAKPQSSDLEKWNEAKAQLAEQVASEVRADPKVLLANFAASAIGDPIIGRALTGARLAKSGAFRSAVYGGVTEGVTEAIQAGTSQYGVDDAVSAIDNRDPMANVAQAALNDAAMGGAFGAGAGFTGGLLNRVPKEPVKNPSADPIRDTNPTLAGAMDAMSEQEAARKEDLTPGAAPQQAAPQQTDYDQPAAARRAGMGDTMQAGAYGDQAIARDNAMRGRSFPTVPGQNVSQVAQAIDDVRALADNRVEGEWIGPERQGRSAVNGLLGIAPIDSETLAAQQAREATAAQDPTPLTQSDIIFGQDGRAQQAAKDYADKLGRYSAAQPKQITDKNIIFADDQTGVTVKGNGLPFASAKEALSSKKARQAKRDGVAIEAVKLPNGYGWAVASDVKKPERVKADDAVTTMEETNNFIPPVSSKAKKGTKTKVFTPTNQEIETEYQLVNANELVPSHDFGGKVNPLYPAARQPRDRSRASSDTQITSIAKNPNPTRLGSSAESDRGAPIVSDGNVVESGNGRSIGLVEAYKRGNAKAYKQYLIDNADEFGLSAADIESMEAPVLVRKRLTPMTDKELQAFTVDSNKSASLGMSPMEQARVDADLIDDDMLSQLSIPDDGNVMANTNRSFINMLTRKLSTAELGEYLAADGTFNKDFTTRVERAIFAKGYDNDSLLELVAESTTAELKNVTNSLANVAGKMSELRSLNPDVWQQLAQIYGDAAAMVFKSRRQGKAIDELVNQGDMMTGYVPSEVQTMALAINDAMRSGKKMTALFDSVITSLINANNGQADVFADSAPLTPQEAISYVKQQQQDKKPQGSGTSQDLFGANPPRLERGNTSKTPGVQKPSGRSSTEQEVKQDGALDQSIQDDVEAAFNELQADKASESKLDNLADSISDKKRAAAEKLKALLKKKQGTLNSGVDPEIMLAVAEVGALSIAEGTVKFAQWVRDVLNTTRAVGIPDEQVKPFLKASYGAIAADNESYGVTDEQADAMDSPRAVAKINIDDIALDDALETSQEALDLADFLERSLDEITDNRRLKEFIAEHAGVSAKDVTEKMLKDGQEAMEVALVRSARKMVKDAAQAQGDEKALYENLVELYKAQPNLNVQSSTSLENQAFSTPAPIAFLASQLAGVDTFTTVYEPTAGNGMLLIGADKESATANELDPARAKNLKKLGFNTTSHDATAHTPGDKTHDAVIMNPPFGPLDKPVRIDGYRLKKLDQLIAAKALGAMKDDGRAVLIIGANMEPGKIGAGERTFFNWLYSNYDVVSHFEVDGKLYSRQGASWPIRVITISGRHENNSVHRPVGEIERVNDWDQLYEKYNEVRESLDSNRSRSHAGRTKDTGLGAGGTENNRSTANTNAGQIDDANGGRRSAATSDSVGASTGIGKSNVNGGRSLGDQRGASNGRTDSGANRASGARTGSASLDQSDGQKGNSNGNGPNISGPNRKRGRKSRVGGGASQYQNTYKAASRGANESVLSPINIAKATEKALKNLVAAVGDVDNYVMEKLGYDSEEELHQAFMGLQVDTVASAIYNMEERDRGIIIADQTGVGKGRQAAGIIRYAMRTGQIPIFVTIKPNLYSDMFGDLIDIGVNDAVPFITNKGEGLKHGKNILFKDSPKDNEKLTDEIIRTGQLPEGRNVLFTTYDQLKDNNSPRRQLINSLVQSGNAVFVLDESHSASGERTKRKKVKGDWEEVQTMAGYVSEMLNGNKVVYLSATYAKRPDNMHLYHRTDLMTAVDTQEELVEAMERGGVPMQQVASSMLAEAGQLFRRERSFEGISIPLVVDDKTTDYQERISNQVNAGLRSIVTASSLFTNVFMESEYLENFKPEGGDALLAGNRVDISAASANEFTSVVHNYIRQLLLGLKAKEAARLAIEAHNDKDNQRKPVIALENTMGSMLEDFINRNNLKDGDEINFTYRDVMKVMLERSRRISVKDEKDNSIPLQVHLHQLDPATKAAYIEAERAIDQLELDDLPASPIDYMLNEMRQAGMTTGEITGRAWAIDYSQGAPIVVKLPKIKASGKRAIIDKFNGGTHDDPIVDGNIDALVMNVSGATGLSIHASEKFYDDKPRFMIVAQAMLDINVLMQMLGRINRTGQVEYPTYALMALNIPAEIRPMANTGKKLAMLNANTSANDKSDNSFDAPDFINKYGDEVVTDFLKENPQIARKLRMPALEQDASTVPDIASKATGRLALLDVQVQRDVYAQILTAYNEKIEYLNSIGQNDLIAQTLDLDAYIEESKIIHESSNSDGNPFTGHTTLHKVNARYQGKPPTPADVQKEVAAAESDATQRIVDAKDSDTSRVAEIEAEIKDAHTVLDALKAANPDGGPSVIKAESDLQSKQNDLEDYMVSKRVMESMLKSGRYDIGAKVRLSLGDEEVNAVVTGIKDTHKPGMGSPYSLSKVKVTFMVNSGVRKVTLPLSQLAKEGAFLGVMPSETSLDSMFSAATTNRRETRYIATGNLFAGMSKLEGGRIVMFTDRAGKTHQGIMMPKKFGKKGEFENGRIVEDRIIRDANLAVNLLTTEGVTQTVGLFSPDKAVRIRLVSGKLRIVTTKANKNALAKRVKLNRELRDIVGDFYGRGVEVAADMPTSRAEMAEAIKAVMDITPLFTSNAFSEQIEQLGGKGKAEAVKSFDGESYQDESSRPDDAGEFEQGEISLDPAEPSNATGAAFHKMDSKHSKSGDPLFVLNLEGDMGDSYDAIQNLVKKHNGYYVKAMMRKYYTPTDGNKVAGKPTFTFKSEEDREAFLQEARQELASDTGIMFRRTPLKGARKGVLSYNAVKTAANNAMKKLNGGGGIEVIVYRTQAEFEMSFNLPKDYYRGQTIFGAYDNKRGMAYLVAENFTSMEDVRKTLTHEVLAHGGLQSAIGTQRYNAFIDRIMQSRGKKDFAAVWAKIDKDYAGASERVKAEEVFANFVENTPARGSLKHWWNALLTWLRRTLENAGILKEQSTKNDMLDMIDAIMRGFKNKHKRQRRAEAVLNRREKAPSDISYSKGKAEQDNLSFSKTTAEPDTRTAKQKLGLEEQAEETLSETIKNNYRETADTLKSSSFWQRMNEGIFDGLSGIKNAEVAAGITDPNKMGYVSARLASGLADVLHGVFNYGAPVWKDGVVQRKENTKGLLEVLGSLPDGELNNWLAWMGANRAKQLKAEGRENNLTQADIDELLALAAGKEAEFEAVRVEYNKINSAILDMAQESGLISQAQRDSFDEEYYVPFFREMDQDPEMQDIASMVVAPFTKKGLAGQSAKIKELKGGKQSTKDLLENIIHRQATMIDASLKNKAMLEVTQNLAGTEFMTKITGFESLSQRELNKIQRVKVMRDGKAETYSVSDPALLRGLISVNDIGSSALFNRMGRAAKRFLTTGITLSPDFIFKNFVRDAAHAWMINKDDFSFGSDSIKGLKKAFNEDENYRDLIFSGAAFQGGYIHGADPEAGAQQVRRALRAKGLTGKDIDSYMDSVVTKASTLLEKYRNASDKVENANRLATYEAALKAGKSRRQAAYESKDLMDYSLKGNFALISTMIDFLPFFNARLQGLSKLVRASAAGDNDRVLKVLSANLAMKGLKVAAFSLALAAMNDDDDRYKALQDWDKDANWHFWVGDDHFRIPKPFELGIIFGTLVERSYGLGTGNQTVSDFGKATSHALFSTLSMNPIPQIALPMVEVMTNRSFFKDAPIEGMGDENRLPGDRYNAYTSDTARELGQLLNMSPKKIEHIIKGYTGTIGGYVLGMSDVIARQMLGREPAETPISRYPVIKAFYTGDEPTGSTYFQSEFYDALDNANQIYGSYKRAMEERDSSRMMDILEDNRSKLGVRIALNRVQRQVSRLNKQSETINNNNQLSSKEKREQLDAITRQKNAIYQAAYINYNLRDW